MEIEKHKQQLEDWWAYDAESFPGSFANWLKNRIEDGEAEYLELELIILSQEQE